LAATSIITGEVRRASPHYLQTVAKIAPQLGQENFFPLPSEFTNHLSFPSYIKARICKYLLDIFPIKESLKQGDAFSPLHFNSALAYAIIRVQENQGGLQLSVTHQLLLCADDIFCMEIDIP
jgi:hypothetical protein